MICRYTYWLVIWSFYYTVSSDDFVAYIVVTNNIGKNGGGRVGGKFKSLLK